MISPSFRTSLFLILFLSLGNAFAQQKVKFEHYTQQDGLPGANTFSILQDHQGFLWVATGIGLARFDGNKFKVFQYDGKDSLSISDDLINVLFEDSDHELWVGTQRGLNKFNRKTGKFTRYMHDPNDDCSISDNVIYFILEDKDKNIWICTGYGGLNRLDKKTGEFSHFRHDSTNVNSPGSDYIEDGYIDKDNKLWLGTSKGLDCMDIGRQKFTRLSDGPGDFEVLRNHYITYISGDNQNNLWFSTYGDGLFQYNRKSKKMTNYRHDPKDPNSISNNLVGVTMPDLKGNVWVSTQGGGLNLLNTKSGKFAHFRTNPEDNGSIGSDIIGVIYIDKEGNLWTGDIGIGVSKLYGGRSRFTSYTKASGQFLGTISSIAKDFSGNLWTGGANVVYRMNTQNYVFKQYKHDPKNPKSLRKDVPYNLFTTRQGQIWMGYQFAGGGLGLWDPDKETFTPMEIRIPSDSVGLNRFVVGVFEDSKSRLWVATQGGLYVKYAGEDTLRHYLLDSTLSKTVDKTHINTMYEDKRHDLWIGTKFDGLYHINMTTNGITHYQHDPLDPSSLISNDIYILHEDRNNNFWVSTIKEGISRLNRETGKFEHFLRKEVTGHINTLKEDEEGNLWFGTWGQGIIKYNPDSTSTSIRYFDKQDGLSSLQICFSSLYSNGKMYFGCSNGIIEFQPDSIRDLETPPAVFITTLKTYRKNKESGEIEVVEEDIPYQHEIVVSYKQNILDFEFAVLSYSKPEKNRYAYQLEGFSDQWIQLGTKHDVTFTNLSPGTYTLRVKGANGDGYWNETPTELKIIITPPWYWAWWSKSLYALLLIGGVYAFYRFQLNRRLAEGRAQLAQERAHQLEELNDTKTRLYMNITHEFRTPLTIILGMVRQIRSNSKQWLDEGLQMIQRNGQNLLHLVNQMLDLAKLESGTMSVNLVQGDLVAYLKYLMESFHSYADSKDIELHFTSDQDELVMDYDPEKIRNIVSNLISNAIKFTPQGGKIYFQTGNSEAGYLRIQVRDTGIGISEEKRPHIFDRFYQADDSATRKGEGTGIGLALAKELVKLMEGRIEVESALEKGSTFTVWLPIKNTARQEGLPTDPIIMERAEAAAHSNIAADTAFIAQKELPTALIVEDNEDVVRYLSGCLQGRYQVTVARDGQEGIEKAIELIPDIIVSDVMMPRKDGFELCDTLKRNWLTSHIPIVLLTARADVASRISGLRKGADAYIGKPFDEEELQVILEKLLELRKTLQAKYGSQAYLSEAKIQPEEQETAMEDAFILQIRQIIIERLDDYELDVTKLCQKLTTSRTQLHNKLKALTGMSTTEFIRSIRIIKAKELLLTTKDHISEIAYQCGFQLPHYFTRVFTEAEGCSPSEYRERSNQR